jgi:hypothetical protein
MAKTLLNGVNEVLKRVSVIQGDSGALTTLTDSGRQVYIDLAVQVLNEVMEEMYALANKPMPNILSENTITLATSDRDYTLQTDLIQLLYPLLDETNGQYILEYPGGYMGMVSDQAYPSNYTGLPTYAVISPEDGELYLDKLPTSDENGLVYKYRYIKDGSLSAAADQFPFSDAVFRAIIPAASQLWSKQQKKEFDSGEYKISMGRAMRFLSQGVQRDSWIPKITTRGFDPFGQ